MGGRVRSDGLMELAHSQHGEIPVLGLMGEVDLHASPDLRAALRKISSTRPPALLVDFTSVEYIDSSGLATLIEYVREASSFKGKIALFGLKPKVRMIFDLVRLNELFTMAPDADAAAAALSGR